MASKITRPGQAGDEIRARVKRELLNCGNRIMGRMVKERLSGPTGPASVRVRSGQLRRSLNKTVATFGNQMTLFMFFGGGVPYARIHEYGGTIIPKRAKNLAIPVGPALTKAGVGRASGPKAIFAMLKFIKNKKTGKKLLVNMYHKPKRDKTFIRGRTQTPGGTFDIIGKTRLEVWFVLVPSVTLPPRLNFGRTFKEETERTVQKINALKITGGGTK